MIAGWQDSLQKIVDLGITEADADKQTDLPGWSVRDILAHLVHIEGVLATGDDPAGAIPSGRVDGDYTQRGVDAFNGFSVAELLERLSDLTKTRMQQLGAGPLELDQPAPRAPGGVTWDLGTMLRNRTVDAWVHEQDLRRALGEPLRIEGDGAQITLAGFAAALPFVVGKKAGVAAGHPVRFKIEGNFSFDDTFVVDDSGRAVRSDAEALTSLTMSAAAFALLAAGRTSSEGLDIEVSGDEAVARNLLNNMGVTP